MLDHIGIAIFRHPSFRTILRGALVPLGIARIFEFGPDRTDSGGTAVGLGKDGRSFFWIGDKERMGGLMSPSPLPIGRRLTHSTSPTSRRVGGIMASRIAAQSCKGI